LRARSTVKTYPLPPPLRQASSVEALKHIDSIRRIQIAFTNSLSFATRADT
jgi:hypothetical protein